MTHPFPIISTSIGIGAITMALMAGVYLLNSKPVSVESRVMIEFDDVSVARTNRALIDMRKRQDRWMRSGRERQARAFMHAGVPLSDDDQANLSALTELQQAALIQMHESHVKRAVVARLIEDCQDKPSLNDYRALVDLGWAMKRAADKWHSLTHQGSIAAAHLEQTLCRRFGLHLMVETSGSRFHVRYRCTCGQWTAEIDKRDNIKGNALSRFLKHTATAEGVDGLTAALKPPVSA